MSSYRLETNIQDFCHLHFVGLFIFNSVRLFGSGIIFSKDVISKIVSLIYIRKMIRMIFKEELGCVTYSETNVISLHCSRGYGIKCMNFYTGKKTKPSSVTFEGKIIKLKSFCMTNFTINSHRRTPRKEFVFTFSIFPGSCGKYCSCLKCNTFLI